MKIAWTYTATTNLESIRNYIHNENPTAAFKVVTKIFKNVEQLSEFPKSGRKGRAIGTRELVSTDAPYIVSYRILQDHIEIIQVLHDAMQWPEKL
jgi:toxin ParE1/3/4